MLKVGCQVFEECYQFCYKFTKIVSERQNSGVFIVNFEQVFDLVML